jgi:hypothetical protein
VVRRTAGPVYPEMILETALPTLPSIVQSVRLYDTVVSCVKTAEAGDQPHSLKVGARLGSKLSATRRS